MTDYRPPDDHSRDQMMANTRQLPQYIALPDTLGNTTGGHSHE